MRIVNSSGRLAVLTEDGRVDVAEASGGEFGPEVQAVYDRWPQFRTWAVPAGLPDARPLDERLLGSPAPQPRQVFAIGLNYLDHAEESAIDAGAVRSVGLLHKAGGGR